MKALLLALILSVAMNGSIYDFKVKSLEGKTIDFSEFRGKKILIVNTASQCGYTPQYADLEKLHQQYRNTVVVIGFPANNFGNQEPGSNEEIRDFCQRNYGVSFLMAEKVSVKGDDIHPLFSYLLKEASALGETDPLKWNFTKFLVDEKGKLVKVFSHKINPMSEDLTRFLN